jgi:hypothetical protein
MEYRLRHSLRTVLYKYLYKRARQRKLLQCRKVYLSMISYHMQKKIVQKVVGLRNTVISIQKFITHSRKIHRLRIKKLVYLWDNYLLKFANLRCFVDQKQSQSTNSKQLHHVPAHQKKEDKPLKHIEELVYKFTKATEAEALLLQPEKKVETKQLVEATKKSKFEVMLDFMKLRGAGLSLEADTNAGLQAPVPSQPSPMKLSKEKSVPPPKHDPLPSFISIMRETLLPYSVNGRFF